MKENRVKRILSEGGLALGTHVGGIADPQIVEIIGLAGFDAAFIDMEHTTYDLHDVQLAVMAAERAGITPIVRTPGFDPAFILRLLDMGVQGIQVPHVSSAETAREAVKAVRYPPLGERGMAAGSRAADYGRIPLVEHMAQSNREISPRLRTWRPSSRSTRSRGWRVSTCWQSAPRICRARSASAASPTIRGSLPRSTACARRSKRVPAPDGPAAQSRRLSS